MSTGFKKSERSRRFKNRDYSESRKDLEGQKGKKVQIAKTKKIKGMLEVLFEENDNDGGGGGMNDGCNIYKMPDQITVMLSVFFTYTCKCKHFHTVGDT